MVQDLLFKESNSNKDDLSFGLPELVLMYTILDRALKDILKKEHHLPYYCDAYNWFFGCGSYSSEEWKDYFYSVESICLHLNIEVSCIRKKLINLIKRDLI